MTEKFLKTAPCGFISFNDQKKIVYANQTIANWLEYDGDELIGKNVEDLFTLATRIFFNTHFYPLLKLNDAASEIFLHLCKRDKTDIPVLVNAARRIENDESFNDCVIIPVHERKKYEDEILKAKKEAEDAIKNNTQLQMLNQAVESHALELESQYQKQLAINENLVQFSKIISHDLQEPLHKILLFTDVVSREEKDRISIKSETALEKIKAAALRLRTITNGLHQFVTIDAEKSLSTVNLNELVEKTRLEVIETRNFNDFVFSFDPLPEIEGFEAQLELMFFHLIDNALQFRDPNRGLRIHISAVTLNENVYRINKERYKFTEHVKLIFSDNGVGFENQYNQYVFELLKKIDSVTTGLGIGLSIIRRVVDNHSGITEIFSEIGKGTQVTIILPLKFVGSKLM